MTHDCKFLDYSVNETFLFMVDYGNCIICKVIVSVAGVIKKFSIKYKYNSLLTDYT